MSLIGVDVGSSAVKAAAFRVEGGLLASASESVPSLHPEAGYSVVDADQVWAATTRVIRRLSSDAQLRQDPPQAIAVSASGRESFPARADGSALGVCLRTADARHPRREATDILRLSDEQWISACGHVPDHRDPTNRWLWWRETDPKTLSETRWFLGWHELISLKLVGRPLIDPALAAGFLLFDLGTGRWSEDRIGALDIDQRVLPEIVAWAKALDQVDHDAMKEFGLPSDCRFVVGSWDGACAAVGAAAVAEGTAMLTAGTWESVVAPIASPRIAEAAAARLAITPQPSTPGKGIWARSPNGTSALDWVRSLTRMSFDDLQNGLQAGGENPSPVLVIPHFAGASPPWPEPADPEAAIFGLTLASSPVDLVKATYEGIAIDLAFAIDSLRAAGTPVNLCRVAGGGSRSAWWMQLKADLLGIPVEVTEEEEPGTLGAALLAGLGIGAYRDISDATQQVKVARQYVPNANRRARFDEKIERHKAAIETMRHNATLTAAAR